VEQDVLPMKRPYQIAAAVILLAAAFLARESIRLRYYTSLGPGPGFFPLWLSIVMGVLGGAMFWRATFGATEPMPADFYADRRGYLRIAAVVGGLIAVIVLMEPIGFRLTMLGFYVAMLAALGRQHWLATGAIALAGSFGVYHIFVHWLAVPLPIGFLGI
jgi:putative tricarboxylic transport membrane protein